MPFLSLSSICLDRCLYWASSTGWPRPCSPSPLASLTLMISTAPPGGRRPRPQLTAPWLTSQVDKPQEVGLQTKALGTLLPRAVRSPADTVKSSPGHLQNTPPTGEQPSVQRLGSAGSPLQVPKGALDAAPLHCQLALKMVRTYAVLFLFFNKINIKFFFLTEHQAPLRAISTHCGPNGGFAEARRRH